MKSNKWTIRPGSSIGFSAVAAATAGNYYVESHTDKFEVGFIGAGVGVSIGIKAIEDKLKLGKLDGVGGADEDWMSTGSPLYLNRNLQQSDSHWMLSGVGVVVEVGAGLIGGASVQYVFFGCPQSIGNPGAIVAMFCDAAIQTAGSSTAWAQPIDSVWMSAFGVVGGVNIGLQASAGITAYAGAWV